MSFRDVVSFQDVPPRSPPRSPRRIVAQPPDEGKQPTTTKKRNHKSRPIVLHGKVQHLRSFGSTTSSSADNNENTDNNNNNNNNNTMLLRARSRAQERESIRQRMQRQSEFSRLAHETQQYQKLVAELTALLLESGETPAAAWRSKILLKSAQESDRELYGKLQDYEKTLLRRKSDAATESDELRTAQTSCMKLHRDFKRSHKELVMAMSLYEKRQRAEVSRLGAVGWSGGEEKREDFFDRAMREREEEVTKMNRSMHQVTDIYKDLTKLVEGQQEQIDTMDEEIRDSRANVEAAERETKGFSCMETIPQPFCATLPFDMIQGDWGFGADTESIISTGEEKTVDSPQMTHESNAGPGMRVSEGFHWLMPFETFSEDLKAVKRDIVDFGKDVMSKSARN